MKALFLAGAFFMTYTHAQFHPQGSPYTLQPNKADPQNTLEPIPIESGPTLTGGYLSREQVESPEPLPRPVMDQQPSIEAKASRRGRKPRRESENHSSDQDSTVSSVSSVSSESEDSSISSNSADLGEPNLARRRSRREPRQNRNPGNAENTQHENIYHQGRPQNRRQDIPSPVNSQEQRTPETMPANRPENPAQLNNRRPIHQQRFNQNDYRRQRPGQEPNERPPMPGYNDMRPQDQKRESLQGQQRTEQRRERPQQNIEQNREQQPEVNPSTPQDIPPPPSPPAQDESTLAKLERKAVQIEEAAVDKAKDVEGKVQSKIKEQFDNLGF